MNRRMIFGVVALVIAGLLLSAAAAQVTQPEKSVQSTAKAAVSASPVSIPFELANRHIVLKIKVNGSRPLSFVLDTGDRYAIIDLDRARELGLKLEGQLRMHGSGAQVMNRFRVLLDYSHERIILEPNSSFGKPYDRAFKRTKCAG